MIATYGKMGCGNVLWEANRLVKGTVIAAGYVPTGHTYLDQDDVGDLEKLLPVIRRIQKPEPVSIPRRKKWWLADLAPAFRSRMGVRLCKTAACNACGLCSRSCPMGSMKNGAPGKDCIRCLRCARACPQKAISVSYSFALRAYLRKPRQEEWIIYG